MDVYKCTLELLDFLFFATTERGKTYETGPFIHNYALTYALAMTGVFTLPGDRPRYFYERQQPNYEEELKPLNQPGLYITPAQPIRTQFRQTQFNTIREGYAFAGKARSIAYPDWGFLRVITPGSKFIFFVLDKGKHLVLRCYLRLGKFMAKARLNWEVAEDTHLEKGPFKYEYLLNWQDLVEKPYIFDILPGALPSKLVYNAQFHDDEHIVAQFGPLRVSFPSKMAFFSKTGGKKG